MYLLVSLLQLLVLKCLSGGKVALIYYGLVTLTFTVQHIPNMKTHHLEKNMECHSSFPDGIFSRCIGCNNGYFCHWCVILMADKLFLQFSVRNFLRHLCQSIPISVYNGNLFQVTMGMNKCKKYVGLFSIQKSLIATYSKFSEKD